MKQRINQLLLVAALMCGAMSVSSCQGLIDAVLGEHADSPTQPTTQPTTPDDPKDPSTDPATIVKATDLLQDAQKEGATVVIWFMYEGDLYRAVFKKVGDDYVLQNGAAATRGGSGAVISNIPNGLDVTLKSGAESNSDAMLVTVTDKSTGKAILQATIDTDTGNIEQLSSTGSYLTGLAIAGTEGISEDVMNSTEAVLTGKAEQEDYDNLVKEDAAGVMLPCVKEDGTISLESMEELTADTKPEEQKDIINQTVDTNKNASEEESGGKEESGDEGDSGDKGDSGDSKKAGSISYAEKTVEKETTDGNFTNKLTVVGDGKVTYSSDKESVATVNQNGQVTIKGAGEATITATVADSDTYTYAEKTATYKLKVSGGLTDYNVKTETDW